MTGKVTLQPTFTSVGDFKNGFAFVEYGPRIVRIDRAGNTYRGFYFEKKQKFYPQLRGNSDNKWGFFLVPRLFFPPNLITQTILQRVLCPLRSETNGDILILRTVLCPYEI